MTSKACHARLRYVNRSVLICTHQLWRPRRSGDNGSACSYVANVPLLVLAPGLELHLHQTLCRAHAP